MKSSNNFLVVFMPHGGETVRDMRVIDAWSCNSKSLAYANKTMIEARNRGEYAKHGEGTIRVVLQSNSPRASAV